MVLASLERVTYCACEATNFIVASWYSVETPAKLSAAPSEQLPLEAHWMRWAASGALSRARLVGPLIGVAGAICERIEQLG